MPCGAASGCKSSGVPRARRMQQPARRDRGGGKTGPAHDTVEPSHPCPRAQMQLRAFAPGPSPWDDSTVSRTNKYLEPEPVVRGSRLARLSPSIQFFTAYYTSVSHAVTKAGEKRFLILRSYRSICITAAARCRLANPPRTRPFL